MIADAVEQFSHDATFMDGELVAAVLPGTTAEVSAVIKACNDLGLPVVARGAGTSLVGGSVPLGGGVVLSLERMTGIEIDTGNVCAIAGAGAITGRIQEEAALHGLMYPPDPASASMSSIGGNVACNSGGPSCLKYGVTADYVMGMTVVLADGQVLRLGRPDEEAILGLSARPPFHRVGGNARGRHRGGFEAHPSAEASSHGNRQFSYRDGCG